ncbi:MAG TPA: hypothetical protein VJU78_20050 [Chitinophagaceae bacterium]|nr:hypothetical protein [Chitinophagaceae bacterium]
MTATTIFLLSLSVLFPFLIGLLRWRVISQRYYPLFIVFCFALLVEILYAFTSKNMAWVPGNNLYILVESILIPLQFIVWGYMDKKRRAFYIIAGILILGWIAEHLVIGHITGLYPYFRMFYSLLIVLLSINMLNYLVIHEEKNLVRHPVFIICTGFIIFFTYQLVYEGIYHIVSNLESIDTSKLNAAFSIINAVCNILYGIAFLLVPTRNTIDWLDEKNNR